MLAVVLCRGTGVAVGAQTSQSCNCSEPVQRASDQCFEDTARFVSSVADRVQNLVQNPVAAGGIQTYLQNSTNSLLIACFNTAAAPLRPLRVLVMTEYASLAQAVGSQFTTSTGIPVTIQSTDYNQRADWLAIFTGGLNKADNSTGPDFDALMFMSEMMGDLASTGALMDLQPYIKGDVKQVVDWNDLQPYQSTVSSMYKQQVVGIPLIESPFIMYVNWPLLTSAYNISRPTLSQPGRLSFYPDTWQELISVMQQVNTTASDPATGLPRHALCLPFRSSITYLLQAVMASIMQTQGYTQGFMYDPLTLEPLTNNTAMQQALHITSELSPFIKTFDLAAVIVMSQCAIALAGTEVFKSLSLSRSNRQFMGQLSMSPLPASTEVLDRSTMQLVPCTQELCNSRRATQLGGQLANLSPHRHRASTFLGMSSQVPEQLRSATYNLIAFIGAPLAALHAACPVLLRLMQQPPRLHSMLNMYTCLWLHLTLQQVLQISTVPSAPFRTSGAKWLQLRATAQLHSTVWHSHYGPNWWPGLGHGKLECKAVKGCLLTTAGLLALEVGQDPMQQPGAMAFPSPRTCVCATFCFLLTGLTAWRSQGYNYLDVVAFTGTLQRILQLPGTAMDMRVASATMDAMTAGLRLVRDSVAGGAEAFREQLWGTTGFVPPALPPPPSPPSPPSVLAGAPGISKHETSIVIAVSVVVCCLVLGLLGIVTSHWRRNARLQRSLMGHVLPPAAGDKATLVITDVQGSSKLWEVLPAAVVEASMKLHDNLIRRLAQDHAGYEFGTEGDSFLLCFHTPAAAVHFATQLQEALLLCTTWPVELQDAGSTGLPLHLAPVHTGTSKSSSGSAPKHSFISLASAATTWNGHDRASPPSYRASALLSRTAKSLKVLRLGPKADGHSRVSSAQQCTPYFDAGSASQPARRSGNGAAAVVPEHLLQQRLNPVFSAGLNHHSTSSATSARQVQPTASHPSTQSINIELVQPQPQQAAPGRSIAVHAVEGLLSLFAHQPTAQPAGPPDGKLSTVVSSNSSIPPNQDQVGSSSGAATTSQLDLSTASHSALGQGRVGWQQLCALYREVGPEAPAALMVLAGLRVRVPSPAFALCMVLWVLQGLHTGLAASEVLVQSRMGASATTYGWAALELAKAVQVRGWCVHCLLSCQLKWATHRWLLADPLTRRPVLMVARSHSAPPPSSRWALRHKDHITALDLVCVGVAAQLVVLAVQLPVEELRAAGISVVHMGKHLVASGEGKPEVVLDLYCATLGTPAHAHRLWALGPLRSVRQLEPGVLHAPIGSATTAFMSVAGLAHVKAWDASLAQECLSLYQATAQRALQHVAGPQLPAGYLVSSVDTDGMILAAFTSSLQCLHWALLTLTTCKDLDWPQALLDSPMGEEVVTRQYGQPSQTSDDQACAVTDDTTAYPLVATATVGDMRPSASRTARGAGAQWVGAGAFGGDRNHFTVRLLRGLRLRVGVDVGEVVCDLTPANGRFNYRGRCLNRAARINSIAESGQVGRLSIHIGSASCSCLGCMHSMVASVLLIIPMADISCAATLQVWCSEAAWAAARGAASPALTPSQAHGAASAAAAVHVTSSASWSAQSQQRESTLAIAKSVQSATTQPSKYTLTDQQAAAPTKLRPAAVSEASPAPAPAALDISAAQHTSPLGMPAHDQTPAAQWQQAQHQLHSSSAPTAVIEGGAAAKSSLPVVLPDQLPPLVAQPLGQVELRGIPGQVTLLQVALASHTGRAQQEASGRLGLTAPGLQVGAVEQLLTAAVVAPLTGNKDHELYATRPVQFVFSAEAVMPAQAVWRLVLMSLLLPGSIGVAVSSQASQLSNCSESVQRASDQCFEDTARFVASVADRCAGEGAHCTSRAVPGVKAVLQNPGTAGGIQTYLQNSTNSLLNACFNTAAAPLRPLRMLIIPGYVSLVQLVTSQFTASTGIPVTIQSADYDLRADWMSAFTRSVDKADNSTGPDFDALMFMSEMMGELGSSGALMDLQPFIKGDAKQVRQEEQVVVDWNDLQPYQSSVSSLYKQQVTVAYNISRPTLTQPGRLSFYPDTWQELISVMQRVNATASDPATGLPRHALCLPLQRYSAFLLQAVMASIMQTQGYTQGFLYDPLTLEPLTNNTAMQQALRITIELSQFFRTFESADVVDMSHCAIALAGTEVFKSLSLSRSNRQFMGQLSMSPLPASTEVLDRSTMQLVPCTQELCNSRRATHFVLRDGCRLGGQLANLSPSRFKEAFFLGMSSHVPEQLRSATYNLIAFIGAPLAALHAACPGLQSMHSSRSPTFVQQTEDNNHVYFTVLYFCSKCYSSQLYRPLHSEAQVSGGAGSLNNDTNTAIAATMDAMTAGLRLVRDSVAGGADGFREQLWGSTGFVPPALPPPPSPPSPPMLAGSPGLSKRGTSIVITVSVVVCCLVMGLLGIITAHWHRNAQLQRSLLGHVLAPAAGDKATLVITDVQGSSKLWEVLPAAVVEASMKLHDNLIRRLAQDHAGYEFGTEGDRCGQQKQWLLRCDQHLLSLRRCLLPMPAASSCAFTPPQQPFTLQHSCSLVSMLCTSPLPAHVLQEALLLCTTWPVELQVAGSPGLPLHLASVHTGTSKSSSGSAPQHSFINLASAATTWNGHDRASPPSYTASALLSRTAKSLKVLRFGPKADERSRVSSQSRVDLAQEYSRHSGEGSASQPASRSGNGAAAVVPEHLLQQRLNPVFSAGLNHHSTSSATSARQVQPTASHPSSQSINNELVQPQPQQAAPGRSIAVHAVEVLPSPPVLLPSPLQDQVGSSSGAATTSQLDLSTASHSALGQGRVGWQQLCALYREVGPEAPAALMVLAGLRVRVPSHAAALCVVLWVLQGLHTGLAASEVLVQSRMGASATSYGGAALELAKAVQACAHGGQITLSASTFLKLPVEELRAAGISVVHMGKHLVAAGEGKPEVVLDLYCATLGAPAHAHRLWALGPLRSVRQLEPGVLHAPIGSATTAFMSVAGLAHVKAWDASLAQECLSLYQATAQRALQHVAGPQLPAGYLVSSVEADGMILAAFPSSLQCLHWALLTLTTCKDLDWPQALLDSPMGEEVVTRQYGQPSQTSDDQACAVTDDTTAYPLVATATVGDMRPSASRTARAAGAQWVGAGAFGGDRNHFTVRLFRGLRLRVGVDVGEVACDLTPANGRFNYRGRCLNRAARINSIAESGQVWCSEAAWAAARGATSPALTPSEAHGAASAAAAVHVTSSASWSAQSQQREGALAIAKSVQSATTQPSKYTLTKEQAAAPIKLRPAAVSEAIPAPAPASLDISAAQHASPLCMLAHDQTLAAQWQQAQHQLHSSSAPTAATDTGAAAKSSLPVVLPDQLPPLVAQPLGQVELRGIPGQVTLLQVALASHTGRAQQEASGRLGLTAPGLQVGAVGQLLTAAVVAPLTGNKDHDAEAVMSDPVWRLVIVALLVPGSRGVAVSSQASQLSNCSESVQRASDQCFEDTARFVASVADRCAGEGAHCASRAVPGHTIPLPITSSPSFTSTIMFASCRVKAVLQNPGTAGGIQTYLQNSTNSLLNACFNTAAAPLRPLRLLIIPNYVSLMQLVTSQFTASTGIPVTLQSADYDLRADWMSAFTRSVDKADNSTGPDFDALMFMSEMMGELGSTGALMDLQPFIKGDAKQVGQEEQVVVDWNDLQPYQSTVSSLYKQQVLGVPIVENPFIMYVNWPLLTSAYNIRRPTLTQPGRLSFYPDTWQELISVMRRINATASDPATGLPRHALCLPLQFSITFLLQAVMASIMQTQGYTQGFLYDPLTLEPLTNNTAMQQVVPCRQCNREHEVLHISKALLSFTRTFDSADVVDMSQCAIALAGDELFKSLNVYRSNHQFMGQLSMSPLPASTEVLDRSTMQLVPCTQELCNSRRATQHRASVFLGMSSQVPEQLRSATYNLIAFIGLTVWRSLGYNYSDVVVSGIAGSPSNDTTAAIAAAMDAMTAGLRLVRDSVAGGADGFREQLWGSTGFVPPALPPPPSPPSPPVLSGSPGLSKRGTSIVIAVSVVVCCLVLGLLGIITAHWRRNAQLQRSLLGHVLAPAAGDKATLVITDVQGSSKLWEVLPAAVVEASMKLHDNLIRRLAQDHAGYEFGTEGDSMLCTSPLPAHVLQEALLLCTTWPAELQVAGSPGLPLHLAPVHTGTSKSSSGSAPQHSFINLASAATTWNGHDRASPPSYTASALLSRTAKSLKILRFGPKADERSRVSSQSRVDLAQEYSRHSGEGSASQPASRSGNGAAAVVPEHLLQQRLNPVFSAGLNHHSTSSATSARQVQPTASHPSSQSINIELVQPQPQQVAPGRSIAIHAVENGQAGMDLWMCHGLHLPLLLCAGPARPVCPPADSKSSWAPRWQAQHCCQLQELHPPRQHPTGTLPNARVLLPSPLQDQVGSSSGAATTSQLDLSTASHSALGQGRVGWQQLCALYREVGPEAPAALMVLAGLRVRVPSHAAALCVVLWVLQGLHTGLAASEVLVQSRMGASATTYGGAALELAKAVQVRDWCMHCLISCQLKWATHHWLLADPLTRRPVLMVARSHSAPPPSSWWALHQLPSHATQGHLTNFQWLQNGLDMPPQLVVLAVQLPVEELRAAGISVVHMGKHLVASGEGKPEVVLDLYCATLGAPVHAHRLWALGPLRSVRQLEPGVLHAPIGSVTTAFMSVAGLAHVKAWDASLAQECLSLYQATAQRALQHVAGPQLPAGYLVSSVEADGMILAAFPSSLQCLLWALLTLTTCKDLDWPQALLDSPMGEEVVTRQYGQPNQTWDDQACAVTDATTAYPLVAPATVGDMRPSASRTARAAGAQWVGAGAFGGDRNHFTVRLLRGLRLRVGVDVGEVACDLTPANGRFNYRGRCLNRAARINSIADVLLIIPMADISCAATLQVWCSEAAWAEARGATSPDLTPSQAHGAASAAAAVHVTSSASWSAQSQQRDGGLAIAKSVQSATTQPSKYTLTKEQAAAPIKLRPAAVSEASPAPAPASLDISAAQHTSPLGMPAHDQTLAAQWQQAQHQLHSSSTPTAATEGHAAAKSSLPMVLPDQLPPLVAQPLGQVELRGIPGQVTLLQVALASHTGRAQQEASARLGLTAPGLQVGAVEQLLTAAVVAPLTGNKDHEVTASAGGSAEAVMSNPVWRLVTFALLLPGSVGVAVSSQASQLSNCSESVQRASDQCFEDTARFVASVADRCAGEGAHFASRAVPGHTLPLPITSSPSCTSTIPGTAGGIQTYLQNSTNSLLNACFNTAAAPLRPLRMLIIPGYVSLVQLVTSQFTASTGIPVTIQSADYNLKADWMAAFTRSVDKADNSTGPDFDALMFMSEMMGELGSSGALMDLQPFIKGDAKQVVDWNDLQPYQSTVSSLYKQQVTVGAPHSHRLVAASMVLGIPTVENPFIMYVNWPLLTSAYNISRPTLSQPGRLSFYPDTWQELISVMQRVNATASDPATGLPRHALCLPLQSYNVFLLQAVMASIMQTQGYTQGFLYDPLTLEPLTNNTAMQQTLHITKELSPYIRTFDLADVVDMSQYAIALAGTEVFKSISLSRSNRQFMGQLSMSPLPASTEVLDRSTMQLVPCTQELCNSRRATQLGGQLANLSPSRFKEAFFLGMSSQVPEQLRSATYNLIAFIGQQDPQEVIQTALTGLLTRPSSQVSGGADSLNNDTTTAIAATMDAMTTGLRLVRDSVAGGADGFREQLWGTTGFVPPALPPPPSPPSPPVLAGSPGLSKRETSIVVAVSVVMCCLVLGLLGIITVHWRRNARLQRSLMGHVLPPAAGDKATLVITDVQGSSRLWEVLPAAVVEASMKLHDNLIRRLAQDHAGYEFGTEGDSFLLCFHTPAAAIRFATQLQEALLLCTTWPAELQVAGSPGLPLHLAPVHTGTSQSSSGSAPQHSRISLASAATTWNHHDRASPSSFRASALISRTAKSLKVLRFGQNAEGRSRVSSQSRVDLAQQYSRYSGEGSASQPASRSGNGAAAVAPEQTLQQRLNPVFSVGLSHHSTSTATSAHQVQPTASHPSSQSINIELVHPQPQQVAPGRSIAIHAIEGLLGLFAHQPTAQPAGPQDGKLSTVVSSNSSFCPPQDQVGSSSGAATTSQLDLSTASHSALGQGRVGWQQLCALHREVGPEAAAALMVLAGLRVRVGLHTGLAASEVLVQSRMGASATTYGGAALELAKAVQACAHGGQITLSAATFLKLPVEELRAAGISVVHMGKHLVASGEGKPEVVLDLYCATLGAPAHAHRLWALGPLRSVRQLEPGVLHAPIGSATTAFMSVAGLAHVKAWDASLAQECLSLYQATAQQALQHVAGPQLPAGYLVSSVEADGMILAAFPSSLQCLHWALLTLTTCKDLDWPQALLDSPMGEEVVTRQYGQPSQTSDDQACAVTDDTTAYPLVATATVGDMRPSASRTTRAAGAQWVCAGAFGGDRNQFTVRLFRGLRLRVGVDVGEVACDLTPANGRFNYRGRCLNRAARINSIAESGQVWCSEAAWAAARGATSPALTPSEAHGAASAAAAVHVTSSASWSAQSQQRDGALAIAKSVQSATTQPSKYTLADQQAAVPIKLKPAAVSEASPAPAPASLDISAAQPSSPLCMPAHDQTLAAQWQQAQHQLHSSSTPTAATEGGAAAKSSLPVVLPAQLPPLVAQPLGQVELRGIPGQVTLLQVALASHTGRAQQEASARLGLTAPGLQISAVRQLLTAAVVAPLTGNKDHE
ncbi:hypothetical protein QJQ45_022169 [Haematococcus lacustris]|nr:hypothetical protein QJQ45_022169 [Haematococcus lacustris]